MSISCDCNYDLSTGDSPDFYEEFYPKARWMHICYECGEKIKCGEKYHLVKGKWDGSFEVFKTCMPCHDIREYYYPRGYIFGELLEMLEECLGFDYTEIPEDDEME